MRRKAKIILLAIVFSLALFLGGTMCRILWVGLHDDLHKADVAIVFASKVERDGTLSARLVARLNKALQLYKEGYYPYLIVSGAVGKYGDDEAGAMRDYLIRHGIAPEHIYADRTAPNSYTTALHASRYMQEHGMKSALVVTQYFHIARCKLALRKCGIAPIYHAHANIVEWRDPYFLLRESVGYWYYYLRFFVTKDLAQTNARQ